MNLLEDVRHIVFAHSGDAMPIEARRGRGADYSCTTRPFSRNRIDASRFHATSEEAFAVARASGRKSLLIHHLSVRYERSSVSRSLRQADGRRADSRASAGGWMKDVFCSTLRR
jgi:ribonuclease BN (tRNA processing enzyme)